MASIESLPIELLSHIIRLLLLDLQHRLPDVSQGSSVPSLSPGQVEVLSISSNLVLLLAAILFVHLIPTTFTCLQPLPSGSTAMLVDYLYVY
ncbi:hypothetical protein BT69DRAFT_1291237, partial [Atractiella rhizophila]